MSEGQAKTLTDRQQKKALSSHKASKGLNRSVRNVLAKPYSCFWPLVDVNTELEVVTLLQSLLPAARKLVTPEDRRQLRGMQGKKLKDARKALTEKIWERNPQAKNLRNCLVMGVNDVSRGLEENTVASLLISNGADPPILTRHLATLAATRKVPHIVLQNLKNCTKEGLDFSALALGFKRVVADEALNHFHPVHLKVDGVFKKLAKSMLPESSLESVAPSTVLESPPQPAVVPKSRSPSDIYLTRSSRKYRAFHPGKGVQTGSDSSWSPFISLSSTDSKEHSPPVPKESKEILGSRSVPGTFSFLQKVRDAKKGVIQSAAPDFKTGEFLAVSGSQEEQDGKTESTEKPSPKKKPAQRYFSSLAPLKVKRIQGNPMKVKKSQKEKKK